MDHRAFLQNPRTRGKSCQHHGDNTTAVSTVVAQAVVDYSPSTGADSKNLAFIHATASAYACLTGTMTWAVKALNSCIHPPPPLSRLSLSFSPSPLLSPRPFTCSAVTGIQNLTARFQWHSPCSPLIPTPLPLFSAPPCFLPRRVRITCAPRCASSLSLFRVQAAGLRSQRTSRFSL